MGTQEQGAVGLGGDGAALAGRRADCVRRECMHAEVASCGKVCVRMERRGVGEACGDEEPTDEAWSGDAYRTELRLAEACGSLLVPRVRGRGAEARCQGWGLTGRRVPTWQTNMKLQQYPLRSNQ